MLLWSFLAWTGLTVSIVAAECGAPVLKEDAADRVEAGFKKVRQRGRQTLDYRKIEIIYYPFLMVEDPACITAAQLNLEVKTGNDNWVAMEGEPRALGGGRFMWTVDAVPCKDHLLKFWFNGEGGQAELPYPTPVSAATDEEIAASGFTPSAPTGLKVTHLGDNSVELSWEAAACATAYDLSYVSESSDSNAFKSMLITAGQGTSIIISEGLKACSDYHVTMYALIGENGYSNEEATVSFSTPPDASSADTLEPEVSAGVNSVEATWKGFSKLSCVNKYAVTVCKEQGSCDPAQELERNDNLDYMKYETKDLDQCSPYTLQIKPLYGEESLAPKILDFRTLSPKAEGLSDLMDPVTAEAGEEQMIYIKWNAVQCAEYYEVFQKVNSEDGDWELVSKTSDTNVALKGVPCTEFRYGVKATIDGKQSEIREAEAAVMTALDNEVEFSAPNLQIDELEDGALVSWDHGACIQGYQVRACNEMDNTCEEADITGNRLSHNISQEIHGLKPCTEYILTILPLVGEGEFEPSRTVFRTAAPAAAPPVNFTAIYKKETNKVELEWSEVECASGYKILQRVANSETITAWTTDNPTELFTVLDSPEPCVTYSYGVAATVGGVESPPTPWEEFTIPPRHGLSHQPTLTILDTANSTVSFTIKQAPANLKCQVAQYEVKYSSPVEEEMMEVTVDPAALEDGLISLDIPGAADNSLGFNIQGRIKYENFETYSPWIQSSDPSIIMSGNSDGQSILVPIIIGILVGLVVILVAIFFLVKRNRSQKSSYDTKKDGDQEEKENLNTPHVEV